MASLFSVTTGDVAKKKIRNWFSGEKIALIYSICLFDINYHPGLCRKSGRRVQSALQGRKRESCPAQAPWGWDGNWDWDWDWRVPVCSGNPPPHPRRQVGHPLWIGRRKSRWEACTARHRAFASLSTDTAGDFPDRNDHRIHPEGHQGQVCLPEGGPDQAGRADEKTEHRALQRYGPAAVSGEGGTPAGGEPGPLGQCTSLPGSVSFRKALSVNTQGT